MKTITIRDEAYKKIKALKHKDESFSKLFLRLADEKKSWKKNIGSWSHLDIRKLRRATKSTRKELDEAFKERCT